MRELLSALGIDRPTINDWISRKRSSNDTKDSGETDCYRRATRGSVCDKANRCNPEEESSQPPSAPCRLLTRLAANPGSDVSQILAASDIERADSTEGGLPCQSAYKLLMRYATSEEKMKALARSLEEGCVPNSGGGCKVKNETVSQALLDICL